MVGEILNGRIQAVYVTNMDRLSRDNLTTPVLNSIFKEHKVRLFDCDGEINLNDINTDLLTKIKSLIASFEITKMSANIKRTLERNMMDGRVAGAGY